MYYISISYYIEHDYIHYCLGVWGQWWTIVPKSMIGKYARIYASCDRHQARTKWQSGYARLYSVCTMLVYSDT